MEANKNRFIEDWSSARENLEHNFRWTRRNFALVGLFGIALPIFIYKGIVKEFVNSSSPSPNLSFQLSEYLLISCQFISTHLDPHCYWGCRSCFNWLLLISFWNFSVFWCLISLFGSVRGICYCGDMKRRPRV